MLFFLASNFFISSGIIVLTHAFGAETVTGCPTTVETEFTESTYSEEIVDQKGKGEDEQQVTLLKLLRKKEVFFFHSYF